MPAHRSTHKPLYLARTLALVLSGMLGPALAQPRPPAAPASGAVPRSPAASVDGLSDAVARCAARPDGPEKRACRRALAHQTPART
jgi:hypothetical protein